MLLKAQPVAKNTTKSGDSIVVVEGSYRGSCGYLVECLDNSFAKIVVFDCMSNKRIIEIDMDYIANINRVEFAA
jgi:ribosomal protein L24